MGWITGEDDGAGVGLTDGCAVVGLSVVGSLVVGLADGGFTGDADGASVGLADGFLVVCLSLLHQITTILLPVQFSH